MDNMEAIAGLLFAATMFIIMVGFALIVWVFVYAIMSSIVEEWRNNR